MAYTDINSEDRLVQETFAEHLRNDARLGERLCLERRDVRAGRHAGPRRTRARWCSRATCARPSTRLNPQLPPAAVEEAVQKLTRHDFSRSLLQHNQEFYKFIRDGVPVSYRDAQGQLRHAQARVIDFQNGRARTASRTTASSRCAS